MGCVYITATPPPRLLRMPDAPGEGEAGAGPGWFWAGHGQGGAGHGQGGAGRGMGRAGRGMGGAGWSWAGQGEEQGDSLSCTCWVVPGVRRDPSGALVLQVC